MSLHVGLVACCLNTPHMRGMGRYVHELLRESTAATDVSWRLYGDDPRYPMSSPDGIRASADVFSFRGDRFHLWEQIGLPLHARRDRVQILHCTEGSLPRWQPMPTVVTVHDTLAWQESTPGSLEHHYFHRLLPAALRRAAAVITISASSERDIVEMWPELAAKVVVIPHGIAEEYFEDGAGGPTSTELQGAIGDAPYVVYLGGPMARKRFDWALQVLLACPEQSLHLVACGFGAAARDRAKAALPAGARERVHFAPFLEDAELRSLYRGAKAVLYPTLYEGFGFPVIESHAAGTPIVFSTVGSLAELVGPLAFLADAHDADAWGAALMQALSLGERRAQLAVEARAWARRYSWQSSWDAHLATYRQVAAGARA